MRLRIVLVACAALALSVGVATAWADGGHGNSDNAKACQKDGWKNLVRQDGTPFRNQGDCVSYAAQGNTLQPKPTCTAGSEDFSGFTVGAAPGTFAGGTIDTGYGEAGGGVVGPLGGFSGNSLFTGFNVNSPFRLTFTNAVSSVQLDAESNVLSGTELTLTAYDASNAVVDSDSATQPSGVEAKYALSVSSSGDNIKYFTIDNDDSGRSGIFFGNVVWGCS